MSISQQYEFCTIQRIDKGQSSSTWRTEFVAYQGSKILAKSKEVSLDVGFGLTFMSREKIEERALHHRGEIEGSYQELLQNLLLDGWEPFGTNNEGRIMTLRKFINN